MPNVPEENARNSAGPATARPARSVLSNWMTYVLSGTVSFFLSPFIVRHLGNSAYGVWVLLVSMTGYLGFLDLGIRGAVTRYVPRSPAEGNHEQASRTVSSASGMFLLGGFAALIVSASLAFFAVPHFDIPRACLLSADLVVLMAGANVPISLLSGVFGGILVGLQLFNTHNSVAVVIIPLRTIAI